MSKTMSIRMDRDNYEFLSEITKEERSDLSKAVRDLVTRGRILFAVERYKKGEASLGKAAELAGLPLGQMMTILGIWSGEPDREGRLSSGAEKSPEGMVKTASVSWPFLFHSGGFEKMVEKMKIPRSSYVPVGGYFAVSSVLIVS